MRTQPDRMVFPTDLGWMALAAKGGLVSGLSFGHSTPQAAVIAVADAQSASETEFDFVPEEWASLVERLQRYAAGGFDDFLDVELLSRRQTHFQRRVIERCRRIPFASTVTYGELGEQAGYARAARAVGNCMRTNHVPLIVPCHRVVGAGGSMRGYSAGEGIRMKLRLLEMEAACTALA